MTAALLANNAATELTSGISDSATSLSVADGSSFPSPSGGTYAYLTLQNGTDIEIVKLTARSGNTLTVTRAQDGTTAKAFLSGTTVAVRVVKALFEELDMRVVALERQATVATNTALADIAPANRATGNVVFSAGRAAVGDGGHGDWRFDASSSATANGITVVAPTTGTGRWHRVYIGPLKPEWGGAKADNTTDCLAAAEACAAISGFIEWGDGDYYFSDDWDITNLAVFMYGGGPKNTRLRFAANKNGVVVTNTAGEVVRVDIASLAITTSTTDPTTAGTGKRALSITWAETFDFRMESKGSIKNVAIMGYGYGSEVPDVDDTGWHTGIELTQWVNFEITDTFIIGKDTDRVESGAATQANKTQSKVGLSLLGGVYPVELRARGLVINNYDRSVMARGAPEGIYLTQCTFGQTRIGVDIEPTTFSAGIGGGSALYRPLVNISQCHIWAYESAVRLYGMVQSHITNNLFYHIDLGSQAAELIDIEECGSVTVKGNKLYTFASVQTCTGIVVANTGSVIANTIEDNSFGTMDKGIWLKSTAGKTILRNNVQEGTYASGFIDNDSTGTIIGPRRTTFYRSNFYSLANNTGDPVPFSSAASPTHIIRDNLGIHGNTGLEFTWTVPANVYSLRVSGGVIFAADGVGYRLLRILKNGAWGSGLPTVTANAVAASAIETRLTINSAVIDVVPGDVLQMQVLQNSGGALDVSSAWLEFEEVG